MRLARIDFAQPVCIALGATRGAPTEPRSDLREQSFLARDGWEIHELAPGHVTMWCEGMPDPVGVQGYAYSYVTEPVESEPAPATNLVSKGKKR